MNDAPQALPQLLSNTGASAADAGNANERNRAFSSLITAFTNMKNAVVASMIGGETGVTPDIVLVSKGTSARVLQPSGVPISALGALTNMNTDRVLGRDTAGVGPVEELTLTQVLDFVGSAAHGDILYRDSALWARLPAGTTGQVLTTAGAGADPAWGPAGAPTVPQGRLTLTTNTPVMTATASAQTTVRYTPYLGRYVPIYNGTAFAMTDTGGELTQATTDTTKSPAAVANNSNYDIFVWSDSGTMRATRGPAWSSDTSRGTGAGTTELVRVNGFLLNAVSITNGPAAQRGTYVGSIRSNGTASIDWIYGAISPTAGFFGVWNMYNRTVVSTFLGESTNTWTYNSTTWRSTNANNNMRVSFIMGLAEDGFEADSLQYCAPAAVGTAAVVNPLNAVGYDSTSAPSGRFALVAGASASFLAARLEKSSDIGFHFMQSIERCTSANTVTFTGDLAGGTVAIQSGFGWRGKM